MQNNSGKKLTNSKPWKLLNLFLVKKVQLLVLTQIFIQPNFGKIW